MKKKERDSVVFEREREREREREVIYSEMGIEKGREMGIEREK